MKPVRLLARVALDPDFLVGSAGLLETLPGLGLLAFDWAVLLAEVAFAALFLVIFAGNINRYLKGNDALSLDTNEARLHRFFFQRSLVLWALRSTSALFSFRETPTPPGGALEAE